VCDAQVGIGVGRVSVLHVGGVCSEYTCTCSIFLRVYSNGQKFDRMEYLAVGDPLLQAFAAEHSAVAGQVHMR
jgi:hypothetical protein